LALYFSGLPALNGLIVTRLDKDSRSKIAEFATKQPNAQCLLRHDKSPENPPYPMGGYLVSLSDIEDEVRWYTEQERIVLLLEPCDPLTNSYNVSALFHSETTATLEIVGPGFDASDLQRGHISPHETMEIEMGRMTRERSKRIGKFGIRSHWQIDAKSYQESVRRRYLKIHDKILMHRKTIPEANEPIDENLVRLTREILKSQSCTNLIEHEDAYAEIPKECLLNALNHLARIPKIDSEIFTVTYPCVAASSYVNSGSRYVIWDIVIPSLKYSPTK
jgi:hypothetical protein